MEWQLAEERHRRIDCCKGSDLKQECRYSCLSLLLAPGCTLSNMSRVGMGRWRIGYCSYNRNCCRFVDTGGNSCSSSSHCQKMGCTCWCRCLGRRGSCPGNLGWNWKNSIFHKRYLNTSQDPCMHMRRADMLRSLLSYTGFLGLVCTPRPPLTAFCSPSSCNLQTCFFSQCFESSSCSPED